MPLTDEQIKERLQRAGYTSGPFYEDPRIFTELCKEVLAWRESFPPRNRANEMIALCNQWIEEQEQSK
jgi:hypothetical protein